MKKSCVIIVLAVTLAAVHVLAGAPQLISYQGRLTNASGVPQTGNFSIKFTIYSLPAGGTAIWTETQPLVAVSEGLFNVLLGSVTPILDTVFIGSSRYLGIQVGVDPELTPRSQLATVPYTLRAATVDGASGGTIRSKITIGESNSNTGPHAFVTGEDNNVSNSHAVISGGIRNQADGPNSVVAGGMDNRTSSNWAAVGGGYRDSALGGYATVAGGQSNTASGLGSTVGGGLFNRAEGQYSSVPGGSNNEATGKFSFAAGRGAQALHDGCFVWHDTTSSAGYQSVGANQFMVYASGGIYLGGSGIESQFGAGPNLSISKGRYYADNSIVAWGKVTGGTGATSTNEFGVTSVVRNSAGNYTIAVDATASAAANLIPVANAEIDVAPNSAATMRFVSINQVTTNSFDVYITNGSFTPTDNDFVFMVTAR